MNKALKTWFEDGRAHGHSKTLNRKLSQCFYSRSTPERREGSKGHLGFRIIGFRCFGFRGFGG